MNKSKHINGNVLKTLLFVFTLLPFAFSYGQAAGTFTDSRDGHTYRWMMFGKHAWMLDNMRYNVQGGSWVYNGDSTKEAAYGRLYNFASALKACPKGWHLPTDNEWNALITFLGGEDAAGGKLQETDSIPKALRSVKPGETDYYSILLGGVRHNDGTFLGIGLWGGCWSATHTQDMNNNFLFTHNGKAIGKSSSDGNTAFSVKCIRNK